MVDQQQVHRITRMNWKSRTNHWAANTREWKRIGFLQNLMRLPDSERALVGAQELQKVAAYQLFVREPIERRHF